MTQQEIERIARLEEQIKAIHKKQDEQAKKQDEQADLLREVRDALLSARGARWALMSLIGVSGTVGAVIANWWPK